MGAMQCKPLETPVETSLRGCSGVLLTLLRENGTHTSFLGFQACSKSRAPPVFVRAKLPSCGWVPAPNQEMGCLRGKSVAYFVLSTQATRRHARVDRLVIEGRLLAISTLAHSHDLPTLPSMP